MRTLLPALALVAVGCSSTPESDFSKAHELLDLSAVTVTKMRSDPGNPGLNYHLERARGILVFPDILKGGLIWGGVGGDGILMTKSAGGSWSAPAYFSVGGINWGPQIGMTDVQAVVLLMNDEAVQKVVAGGMTFGTTASVSAGTAGGTAMANTKMSSVDTYHYVSSSGAYAGATLNGAVLSEERDLNTQLYGRLVTASSICFDLSVDTPKALPLRTALSAP